ncbi:hypothetical protein ABIE51_001448 [Lysobacter sp. OAE881]
MDKTKAKVIALVALIGGALVWGGYATWQDWSGFLMMMFGAR